MAKIIENQEISFNTIDIGNNTSVIDYLKNTNNGFVLIHTNHRAFEAMQNKLMSPYFFTSHFLDGNVIASYAKYYTDNGMTESLLKIEDCETLLGSFVIENSSIIYSPYFEFNVHPDTLAYSQTKYYTEMTIPELLADTLKSNTDMECLLCVGETKKGKAIYQTSDKEELLSYATDKEKGRALIKDMQRKRPIT